MPNDTSQTTGRKVGKRGAISDYVLAGGRALVKTRRDEFWAGPPEPELAWAALDRNGRLMPASVRSRPVDVRLTCGECVPVRVRIVYVPESANVE